MRGHLVNGTLCGCDVDSLAMTIATKTETQKLKAVHGGARRGSDGRLTPKGTVKQCHFKRKSTEVDQITVTPLHTSYLSMKIYRSLLGNRVFSTSPELYSVASPGTV